MFGRSHRPRVDLGLDLGSTTTRLVARGIGLIAEQPTTVAIQDGPGGRAAVAFGAEARQLLGRTTEGTRIVQPVRGGAVDDYVATELLLTQLLQGVPYRQRRRARMLVAMPTDATEVERRALQASARAAGCRDVVLVSAAIAAALGAQIPVAEPTGAMIVNVGGGRTEVSVVSLGGLVVRRSVRVAGEAMDDAIGRWLRRHHHVMVGGPTTERIKIEVGAAQPPDHIVQLRVRGRDLSTGAPKVLDLHGGHVADAVSEPVGRIRELVLDALRETSPDLSADILASGVILVGGGSQLRRLDSVLRDATGLPVLHADAPARCVAAGLTRLLDDPALLDTCTATI